MIYILFKLPLTYDEEKFYECHAIYNTCIVYLYSIYAYAHSTYLFKCQTVNSHFAFDVNIKAIIVIPWFLLSTCVQNWK